MTDRIVLLLFLLVFATAVSPAIVLGQQARDCARVSQSSSNIGVSVLVRNGCQQNVIVKACVQFPDASDEQEMEASRGMQNEIKFWHQGGGQYRVRSVVCYPGQRCPMPQCT